MGMRFLKLLGSMASESQLITGRSAEWKELEKAHEQSPHGKEGQMGANRWVATT